MSESANSNRSLLIRGGRVIDPSQNIDQIADVMIQDGRVVSIQPKTTASVDTVFDAAGLIVAPGFIDIHAHLREPGREHAETIESGGRGQQRAASPPC